MSIKNTLLEMYQQRYYTEIIDEYDSLIAKKQDENKIIAFYDVIEKLNTEELKNYIYRSQQYKIDHIILIYKEKTPQVKTIENYIDNIEKKVELFVYTDLLVNITKHELVPKHILIDNEEKKELKSKIVSFANLPTLLKSDAVAKFYGYEKGSIIKIIRKNGHITYRVVR